MLKGTKKYFLFSLVIALVMNALMPLIPAVSQKDKAYSELSKLLGDKVIICTSTNSNKFYISTFARLDTEQKQHLKNLDDIKKNISVSCDHHDKIENYFYSLLNIKFIMGVIPADDTITDIAFSYHESSRAPPALS